MGPFGKFYYHDNSQIGKAIAEGKFWEDFYKPWFDLLEPGDVLVDVGANMGFFSIYAAKKGATVWAFEVSPGVFEVMQKNVIENEVEQNVKCENQALFDEPGVLTLNPEWEHSIGGRVTDYDYHSDGMSLIKGEGGVEFRSRTLDSYGLEKLHLLKIDTQGADLRVLCGAKETINRCRPIILCEMEPIPARLHGDDEVGLMGFFREADYDVMGVRAGMYGVKDFVAVPRG